jgi:hypothetical protein
VDVEKEFTKERETVSLPPVSSAPDSGKPRKNGTPSVIRQHASDEQFAKAHRKTSAQHAGLFRRLAK